MLPGLALCSIQCCCARTASPAWPLRTPLSSPELTQKPATSLIGAAQLRAVGDAAGGGGVRRRRPAAHVHQPRVRCRASPHDCCHVLWTSGETTAGQGAEHHVSSKTARTCHSSYSTRCYGLPLAYLHHLDDLLRGDCATGCSRRTGRRPCTLRAAARSTAVPTRPAPRAATAVRIWPSIHEELLYSEKLLCLITINAGAIGRCIAAARAAGMRTSIRLILLLPCRMACNEGGSAGATAATIVRLKF